jgi:hypothetical protein
MRPIPLTPETEAVAQRVIWFEEPEKALFDPVRFLAYAMTYATHEALRVIRPSPYPNPFSWAYRVSSTRFLTPSFS